MLPGPPSKALATIVRITPESNASLFRGAKGDKGLNPIQGSDNCRITRKPSRLLRLVGTPKLRKAVRQTKGVARQLPLPRRADRPSAIWRSTRRSASRNTIPRRCRAFQTARRRWAVCGPRFGGGRLHGSGQAALGSLGKGDQGCLVSRKNRSSPGRSSVLIKSTSAASNSCHKGLLSGVA